MKYQRFVNGKLVEFTIDGIDQLSVLVNAGRALGRVAKAVVTRNKITVSPEEQTRRQSICNGCEFFNGKTCAKCGCYTHLKTRLETEHCPIGKW